MSHLRKRVVRRRDLIEGADIAFDTTVAPDPFLSRIISYVPAEVVTGYVAVGNFAAEVIDRKTSFVGLSGLAWYWIVFGIFLVVSPFYIYIATTAGNERPQWFQIVTAPIAFSTWAFALGGPFALTWPDDYSPALGSLVAGIVSVVIGAIDMLIDRLVAGPKK